MGQINQCGFQSHVAIDRYCIFLEINTPFELSWVDNLDYDQSVAFGHNALGPVRTARVRPFRMRPGALLQQTPTEPESIP